MCVFILFKLDTLVFSFLTEIKVSEVASVLYNVWMVESTHYFYFLHLPRLISITYIVATQRNRLDCVYGTID